VHVCFFRYINPRPFACPQHIFCTRYPINGHVAFAQILRAQDRLSLPAT
jgi:hypothetical protein